MSNAKNEAKKTEAAEVDDALDKELGEFKENPAASHDGEKELKVDSYDIQMGDISLPISIVDVGDYVFHYNILLPEIDFVTEALLDETKRSLVSEVQIETRNAMDPGRYAELKNRFLERSKEKLRNVLKKSSDEDIAVLSRIVVNDMIGLGEMEYVLVDPKIEEIVVNSSRDVVWIFHKIHGWLKTNIKIKSEEMIMNYSSRIAREVGREITHLEPLMDAHLTTGDRVNATLFPISTTGNTITIRRFSRTPWTIVHLLDPNFKVLGFDAAAFLWLSMEYEMNMLVSGGTASGKTTMLNAMLPFLPANQRIITIEDTRELNLPEYMHWVPLSTRPPTTRGEGEVSMLDLVENSLRMRPDRIIVGEVRRKREAEVLFEAMHTGHSVYGTFHALGGGEVVERITSPPMDIPPMVMGSLHMVVTQYMNRRTRQRRTFEIAELVREGPGRPKINIIYKWNARTDKVENVAPSIRVMAEVQMFSGMTEKEINEDLEGKRRVLEWLLRKNIKEVNDVGKIITEYYIDKETVLDLVEHDKEV
ncbi:MAG: CpaF family protein [Candidatus Altiarchaeota archaeon]|nr:CpaF family protein [Candidatus Altiarchaeota archaeon]